MPSLFFDQIAEELVRLANDDNRELGIWDLQGIMKKVNSKQTCEGTFPRNVVEAIVVVLNVHEFLMNSSLLASVSFGKMSLQWMVQVFVGHNFRRALS